MLERRHRSARFGPFVADLVTSELRRDGVSVPLQLQPFRVLAALLERRGDLVTRDELRHRLWPAGTHVAFERGLTSAMRKVRAALGDRAAAAAYIETLPGRGYRFVAAVTWASDTVVAAPSVAPPVSVPGRRRAIAPALRLAVVLLLLAVVASSRAASTPVYAERLAAAEALSSYACLLKSQGRVDEGLAAIERAHALVPESARFTAEVGFHLHAARRFEAEFPMLRRAVAQDATSSDAWLHLGLGHARRSNFADAVPALERAASLAPASGAQRDHARFWLEWARQQHAAEIHRDATASRQASDLGH